ncbi:bridge-like lipid transfer protein family member 3A isoform X2 [Cylas formicarius]|uniref:bridge-like lipid transfer protein family member 3A isoform X2 n=1 Tax=Cylas formicarius TaxID=197179 RepID=UPI002958618A|nr:bridge-like lipid transfer protein family member 3A isoform X2 [Cylas formicarius]
MASIIKNQLLKHLSRFTKNLSSDKINLSTFKGEGELSNLELNEVVLTDLLELPSWLRLTKAWCNRVTFRIPWTKLKTMPIHLSLDEVNITVETCEELRCVSPQGALSYAPGKYSFIHKVIDGITVTVNTVNVLFNSPAFIATVQIQRIVVESVTPKFTRMELPLTRLKSPEKGQILIFKELQWQTVRIEAKSTRDRNLTPLRLLTNQARCRITIKKRLSDCFILGSRLVIILDDLLWVLTDSQLKAALHFLDSLTGLIQKATQITRKAKAARKLDELPEYQAQLPQECRPNVGQRPAKPSGRMFSQYDVIETSYHFMSNHIVLHLCDDPGEGRSGHPNLKDGGALQISVRRFQVDFYPYHLAKGDRKHWPTYNASQVPHSLWQEQALAAFKSKFLDLFDRNKTQHAPLSRVPKAPQTEYSPAFNPASPEHRKPSSPSHREIKGRLELQLAKLMTTCVIIRIDDFAIYRVTTSGKKQQLKEFLSAQQKRRDKNPSGDRNRMSLPKEASIVHAEYIHYYYPSDMPFPLPAPKFYVQINPIQIVFDVDTILWMNSFGLNLYQSLAQAKSEVQTSNYTYVDVKIESILPKVNFESHLDYPSQRDRPKCLSIQVTRATVTNVRTLEHSSRADLAKCVDSFHMGSLFFGSDFPSRPGDFYIVTQKFLDHISAADNVRAEPKELDISSMDNLVRQLSKELLWVEAKDIWYVSLDPVFGDFCGARGDASNKPVPFLDAVPVTVWLHATLDPNSTIKTKNADSLNADIHALAYISNLVSIQINHYQYLFLLRLAEQASELTTFLTMDSDRILKTNVNSSMAIGALIPQLEVTFVMPPQSPGKESSGGDGESFVPDFSSIDDIAVTTQGILRNSIKSIPQLENSGRSVSYTEAVQYSTTDSINGTLIATAQGGPPIQIQNPPQNQFGNNIQSNINVGLTSVKKGFSSLMSSIDSALKSSPDDMSDTLSIRSDASSDSEQIVMVNYEEDVRGIDWMFYIDEMVEYEKAEEAAEVIEDESVMTSPSDHSLTSSCRRKDLVCVSTFKLNKVEFLQQSCGYSSSIKVQVGNVASEDCTSIPWDEFQGKFSTRSRGWTDNPENTCSTAKVKLRFDHTLTLEDPRTLPDHDLTKREVMARVFEDMVAIEVRDLILSLNMSTVTGLADLSEDEIIPVPLPLQLLVQNLQLRLVEDRPPVNITSPGSVPIDLDVDVVHITRGKDGVFHVSGGEAARRNGETEDAKVTQLLDDNEELKRRLLAFERISEENRGLRKAQEETDVLRGFLKSSQDEVSRLLDEKRKLLDEIGALQSQLANTTRWQWNSKS